MKIDKSLDVEANLVALILEANPGKSLSGNQVAFSTPTALDGQAGFNTSLLVRAMEGAGFAPGTVTFRYNRLALSDVYTARNVAVAAGIEEFDALMQVATELGIVGSIMEVDVVSFVAPTSEAPGSITIKGLEVSFLYLETEWQVPLVLATEAEPTLAETFTTANLNGFEPT